MKACLNGGRGSGEHPALPVTAERLAAEARAAAVAGAFAVHVHPRALSGAETLDAGPCGEAVAAIRAACPGLPVGLSTAAWIEPDPARRLALIEAWSPRPDFVSVNLHEEGAADLVRTLPALGIGVEAGVWTVEEAHHLVADELYEHCLRVLVEPREPDEAAAVAVSLGVDRVLDEAGVGLQRVHHGHGAATWAVIRAALTRGRDVRVGLEDVLTLPDGRPARDNADLVAAAMTLAAAAT